MFRDPYQVPSVEASAVESGAYLLDVREHDEWVCGHAPEAVHIPLSELMARVDEVPTDSEVFVICKVGGRSEQAVRYLNQTGRTTVNVAGGMLAWNAAGRPMLSEAGDQPFVA